MERLDGLAGNTVAEAINLSIGKLTRTEKRVAQTILSQYPLLGLEALAKVALAAQTSAPTVLRFVKKLGYENYSDFQQVLRNEIQPQLQSPLSRHAIRQKDKSQDHYLQQYSAISIENVRRATEIFPEVEFDTIVKMLSNINRPITLLGGRFSYALAFNFWNLLHGIRPNVNIVPQQTDAWPNTLLNINKKHIVIVFDFRRYQENIEFFANSAFKQGATILLFTDEWMSPISRMAHNIILSPVSAPSLYDTNLGALFQTEALAGAIALNLKSVAKKRIVELESIRKANKIF